MSPPPAARLEGVRKSFGATVALDGADLTVLAGQVHGVLGENGAGKTTLLEILAGHLRPDRGTLELGGASIRLSGPREAWRLGVGMVHQHFTLVPRLTVLENLTLGVRGRLGGLRLPLDRVRGRVEELRERTGLEVPLTVPVEALGVGARQRVEILKVLLRDPSILVLDEPTAVLAPPEVERLLALLRSLADEGRAVVLVAHKLDEVLAAADRVTVLRDGRTVLRAARSEVDARALARAMVGSGDAERATSVDPGASGGGAAGRVGGSARRGTAVPAGPAAPDGPSVGEVGEVVARLDAVRVLGSGGVPALAGVSLTVRRGEIVGIAGVEGNGQRELALLLAGRTAPDEGVVAVPADPGFIPPDRRHEGLILDFDLAENVALALHRDPSLRRGPFVRWRALRGRAAALLRRFDVRAAGPRVPAAALSGGNQQRVVVARELERAGDLLVAANPTRGLDVAAEAYVHRRLLELRRRPRPPGVVLVSTDLDEILGLSDRVHVMVRGRLIEVPPERLSREGVGELMLSGTA